MTSSQDAISIPVAYIEAFSMMLGAFLIGYIGCYLYYKRLLKKQELESVEKNQSLRKRITELKEELEQQDRAHSYQKDRMDQDYEQLKFKKKAFSEKIIEEQILTESKINYETIGYATEEIKDNLQEIQGIGPYTEEKLNDLGIYTFDQISKFTDSEIEVVTELIKFFPDRIKNDKWVGKARNLIYKRAKASEEPEDIEDSKDNTLHKKTTY